MPFIAECARYNRDSGNTTEIAENYTAAVPAGSTIVLFLDTPVLNPVTDRTITDTAGNTYTVLTPTETSSPTNYQLAAAVCIDCKAVTTGDQYTITVGPSSPAKWCVLAAAFDDLAAVDITNGTTGAGSTATLDIGTGSQASQLEIGAVAYTDVQNAPVGMTSSLNVLAPVTAAPTTTTPRSMGVVWQYAAASGDRSVSATLGAGEGWAMVGAALNAQAATPPPATSTRWLITASGPMPLTTTIR